MHIIPDPKCPPSKQNPMDKVDKAISYIMKEFNPEATNGHEKKHLVFFFFPINSHFKGTQTSRNAQKFALQNPTPQEGKLRPSSTLLQYFDITPSKKNCNIFSSTFFQVTQAIVGKTLTTKPDLHSRNLPTLLPNNSNKLFK